MSTVGPIRVDIPSRTPRGGSEDLDGLMGKRRQLLELYYRDQISAEHFAEEEQRLSQQIEAARQERSLERAVDEEHDELSARFAEVVELLERIDLDQVWAEATFQERRVLVEELVEAVTIFPDHLEVKVAGAPKLNVLLSEVGLKESATVGVGGASSTVTPRQLGTGQYRVVTLGR